MLDTSEDLETAQAEIGCPVEQLITPLTRFTNRGGWHGIDNGAYRPGGFRAEDFVSLLERERPNREKCRFVCAPDVVGSAIRTLECFEAWRSRLCGWPIALVMQDGQENHPIPWHCISAIFVGGTTEWKMGPFAEHCIRAGKIMGKWVHVGRVNSPGRFEYFERLGADSIDGSGLARFSWMRQRIYDAANRPKLFEGDMHAGVC